MSAFLPGDEKRVAKILLGPWLIGSCLDLLLQGVLFAQACIFVNYYTLYHDDKRSFKWIVGILLLATTLKSVQAFALIWIIFLERYGDLGNAILVNNTTWYGSGNPLMVALIGLYVQSYFCWRLYAISKKWWIVTPIASLFLFAVLAIVIATYYITQIDGIGIVTWFAIHLSTVFAGDLILSMTTAYFLIKSKKGGPASNGWADQCPRSVDVPDRHARRSLARKSLGVFCAQLIEFLSSAMLNLIFSQAFPGAESIISTIFNMALPKLYAISMMWTLNARRTIRTAHTSGINTSSNEISGGRLNSRAPRRGNQGDIELGAIQVLTQTETHIDVRDMFDPANPKNQANRKRSEDESAYTK
ncbi:hypothetical protein C8J57DRAFT_1492563 [Mycena rebaudengoi]|nr:hypothetical protein C8J57DRAFT_1492563 [Mycena rebaudengoi]